MLVGGNSDGWLGSKERPGNRRGWKHFLRIHPGWVSSCHPQSPIPLPDQIQLSLAERAARGAQSSPCPYQNPHPRPEILWSQAAVFIGSSSQGSGLLGRRSFFSLMSPAGDICSSPSLLAFLKWHVDPTLNSCWMPCMLTLPRGQPPGVYILEAGRHRQPASQL